MSLRGSQICDGAMTLATARAEVATNRVMSWKAVGGPKGCGSSPPHHDGKIVTMAYEVWTAAPLWTPSFAASAMISSA